MIIDLSTATGTQNLWKQERILIKVTHTAGADVGMWTNLHGSYSSPVATYTTPASGVLYIDITDYVRTYPTVGKVSIYSDTQHDVLVSVKGLINPEGLLIPYHILLAYDALIIPPSYMICALDHNDSEQAELYTTAGTWSVTGDASKSLDGRYVGQIDGAFTLSDGTHSKTFNPTPMRCGVKYALVKWVSVSGTTRSHWFEVIKPKSSSVNTYSLLPLDNEYSDIKGREDSFVLKLTNLSAYDLWYYSDVITSSKVEISFDGSVFDRVQITDKSASIPDGEAGTNGKLEINVNYKRYDAVAL